MANLHYPGDADMRKRNYISDIEKERKQVLKNFKDMDLENASAWYEIEQIVDKMDKECKSLLNKLQGL